MYGILLQCIETCIVTYVSIDWFKGKITGTSLISWENLWFPVDFPASQPIECLPKINVTEI